MLVHTWEHEAETAGYAPSASPSWTRHRAQLAHPPDGVMEKEPNKPSAVPPKPTTETAF